MLFLNILLLGVLVDMVDVGVVIFGISVIVRVDIVIYNFDFKYLNECLGNKFLFLLRE